MNSKIIRMEDVPSEKESSRKQGRDAQFPSTARKCISAHLDHCTSPYSQDTLVVGYTF